MYFSNIVVLYYNHAFLFYFYSLVTAKIFLLNNLKYIGVKVICIHQNIFELN